MADDIGARVRAVPGLPGVIADLLGDDLGFSCLKDDEKAMEWALRAYRAGQAHAAAQVRRLNRPMVGRLRKCAADTHPNWDGAATIYPPGARELVDLIDYLLAAGQNGDDRG